MDKKFVSLENKNCNHWRGTRGITPPLPTPPDDDWQEEHARLAELDERDGLLGGSDVSSIIPPLPKNIPLPSSLPPPPTSSLSPLGSEDKAGGDLAESLAHLILDSDPAITEVGAAEQDRSRLPPSAPSSQTLPPGLSGVSRSLLSYQQQQHLLHRGTVPLQQVRILTLHTYIHAIEIINTDLLFI